MCLFVSTFVTCVIVDYVYFFVRSLCVRFLQLYTLSRRKFLSVFVVREFVFVVSRPVCSFVPYKLTFVTYVYVYVRCLCARSPKLYI